MNKIIIFRAVSLCVQLASGCASLEQEPAPEVVALNIGTPSLPTREIGWHAAPADEAAVSEVNSKRVSDMLAFGGYGMLKGAATGALVGLESPLGPLAMIATVPMGALFGLAGGVASPSMEAVGEWRVVPQTNPWYYGDHENQRRVQKSRYERHAQAKPQRTEHKSHSSGARKKKK